MTSKEFIKEHIGQLEKAYESTSKLELVEIREDILLELECFRKVLKDLKVLEILKQYLKVTKTCRLDSDLTETDVIYYFNGKFTNRDEYLLLKEWLENDR